jgi:DNA-binding response OmpR family regulator
METDDAGFQVIRAARKQKYNPATALLTAYPPMNGNWSTEGAQSLLVKPIGTEDLMRQIEALLVRHEDEKHTSAHAEESAGRQASVLNREGGRRVS